LIQQPALVDRRKPGGRFELERETGEFDCSSVVRGRVG